MLERLSQELKKKGTITFKAKITPNSGKHEISGFLANGTMKIKLKSAPEQGKANAELIKLLSEHFEVPSKNITIIKGQNSPLKTIVIK